MVAKTRQSKIARTILFVLLIEEALKIDAKTRISRRIPKTEQVPSKQTSKVGREQLITRSRRIIQEVGDRAKDRPGEEARHDVGQWQAVALCRCPESPQRSGRSVVPNHKTNKKSNNSVDRIHVEPPSTPVLKIGDQSTATLRNKNVPNARVSPEASAPAAQLQAILPRRKEW